MAFETADVDIDQGSDSHVRLSAVPFHFNPGERSLYTGADGSSGVVQRAGWLGLNTYPFTGWFSAHTISVTGSKGSVYVFEVKRNFSTPIQDDEWLWFPVSRQRVEPYRD